MRLLPLPGSRTRALVVVVAVALAGGLTTPTAAQPGRPRPVPHVRQHDAGTEPGASLTVGSVTLRACGVVRHAYCGHLDRRWEPGHPRAGKVRIGFAFVPARVGTDRALGTLVPHEGGPGYATTGTGSSYAAMYGPLLRRHNLLLVDQRGTGRSEPIDCADLQNLRIAYAVAARRCGRQLGARRDDYATALSADDLAAVIRALGQGKVDLYGDSYGTFFAQVFAGRHPGLLRSIVLDSAYPTFGETAWYPTQGPALRSSFEKACRRSPPCRGAGPGFLTTIRRVLGEVRRRPWRGVSHDADGRRMRVVVNAPNLAVVAYGATYGPYTYRELTASLRSGLGGDRAPLLRLVAEALGGGTYAGAPRAYSEGLDAAVSCHDYPQLYDMTAKPPARLREYHAALARRTRLFPHTYGPFTVREYARSDWQALDWCTRWPSAPADHRAHPPRPPHGYPRVPTLILSGEMDSITTPAEGALVARQFPRSKQIRLANSFHVTAVGDTDDCAVRLLRRFVRSPATWPRHRCADRVAPIRALGLIPRHLRDVRAARGSGTVPERRIGPAAAATVADLLDRWWSNYSGHGVGLRGGRWSYTGDRTTVFRLSGVRLTADLAVSGSATWRRYANRIAVDLRVTAPGHSGRLRGAWDTRARGASATLRGFLDGQRAVQRFLAP